MRVQFIDAADGSRLAVLPAEDYQALAALAEDAADAAAIDRALARLKSGAAEMIPLEMAERMLSGESAIRVWREHRDLSVRDLAKTAGISQPYLSQIEAGRRDPTLAVLRRLAEGLGVPVESLI